MEGCALFLFRELLYVLSAFELRKPIFPPAKRCIFEYKVSSLIEGLLQKYLINREVLYTARLPSNLYMD
ncbi:hypothetical protein JCM10003_3458 [Bacteroides pyogenes JCM 10003]|nr:hypothetical protein JCM10003_3458 [Bacteroides pyogenes JCM 10003]